MSNTPIEFIPLSDLIDKVKADLLSQARKNSSDTPLLFVDEIEITAQVVAKREKGEGGEAGLSLSVLGLGVNAGVDTQTTVAHELTQSVTVKLTPLHSKEEYLRSRTPAQLATIEKNGQAMARSLDDGSQETV